MEKLKILHLEDNENDSELVRLALEEASIKFDYSRVDNEKDFVNYLGSDRFSVILSDYSLPTYNGLLALDKAVVLQPETPFIFVSGTLGEDAAVESMVKGATDYVLKNKLAKLVPTLRRALGEVTEKKKRIEAQGRYMTLIESARDVIFTVTPEGTITTLNKAFEVITGWERNEWIGKSFSGLIHKSDVDIALTKLLQSAGGTVSNSYEIKIITKSGAYLTGEFLTTPLYEDNTVYEILGIVRDVTERKRHEQFIMNSLKEKEILLKEIHHRVNNNLQIISSLLKMQSSAITDPRAAELLLETRNRVLSMSFIHQSFYGSYNLSEIDFGTYIRKLTDNLLNVYKAPDKDVIINIRAEGVRMGIDTAIPCGLIINEAVTNSLLHAFEGQGSWEVTINLRNEGENYFMEIKDNGNGIPADVDFSKTSSMGLALIRMLSEQLEGTLTLSISNGTSYSIKFPNEGYLNRLKDVKFSK
jgi:PAS domain S-box-containing protein